MGCATGTIKFVLFTLNAIFALSGLAIIAVGSVIQWNLDSYDGFFGTALPVPSILLIVVGCLVFVIAFCGCCGVIRDSRCMMLTVTGAVLALVFMDDLGGSLKSAMMDTMLLYNNVGVEGDAARQSWDGVQMTFHCCGVNSPLDWIVPPPEGPGLTTPPSSCQCVDQSYDCAMGYYTSGCYQPLTQFLIALDKVIAAVALAVAGLEIVEIIFACILSNVIQRKQRGYGM